MNRRPAERYQCYAGFRDPTNDGTWWFCVGNLCHNGRHTRPDGAPKPTQWLPIARGPLWKEAYTDG